MPGAVAVSSIMIPVKELEPPKEQVFVPVTVITPESLPQELGGTAKAGLVAPSSAKAPMVANEKVERHVVERPDKAELCLRVLRIMRVPILENRLRANYHYRLFW